MPFQDGFKLPMRSRHGFILYDEEDHSKMNALCFFESNRSPVKLDPQTFKVIGMIDGLVPALETENLRT